MSANTLGTLFRLSSFGESHGPAMGGVVDGCPPGLTLSEKDIQTDLDRRRPAQSRYTSQRREPDTIEILSGVFKKKTTGTPIAFLVRNRDQRSGDYDAIKDKFRPNHADYVYEQKYGLRDYRGGGRASARETVVRVAGGAIARKYLAEQGVRVRACLSQLGPIKLGCPNWKQVSENPFACADPKKVPELEKFMQRLIKDGDSIGAELMVQALGVPPGWGAPVYNRLDAALAAGMMSINAVKAVGVGDGATVVEQRGSEHRDEMTPKGFKSNHSGGILGGVSSGQDIVMRVAFKPTSSIRIPGDSVDTKGKAVAVDTKGRHDPCVALRAAPIVEAMMALVLMDHLLLHRAQNAEVKSSVPVLAPKSPKT